MQFVQNYREFPHGKGSYYLQNSRNNQPMRNGNILQKRYNYIVLCAFPSDFVNIWKLKKIVIFKMYLNTFVKRDY